MLKIFSKIAVVSAIVAFVLLVFFKFSSTGMDETILAEQAYWFANEGIVKSKIFEGMGEQGWEHRQYHYHKLLIWTGALFYKVFGWSLYTFKSVPLVFAIAAAIVLGVMLRKDPATKPWAWMAIGLLFLQEELLSFTIYYRPELMVLFFGLSSYYCLVRHIKSNKVYFLIASAILAGLCTLSHLNGLVFCAAGASVLVLAKKWRSSALFILIAGSTALLYLADLHSIEEFQKFTAQFGADPNLKDSYFSIWTPILKVLNFQLFFFWSPKEIVLSIPLVLTLLFYFRSILKTHKTLLIYTGILILALSGLAHGHSTKYALVFYPFLVYIIVLGIHKVSQETTNGKKIAFIAVLSTYIMVQGFYISKTIAAHKNAIAISNRVVETIGTKNVRVLCTDSFVFNELPNYDIGSFIGFRYNAQNYLGLESHEITKEMVFTFAKKFNHTRIVLIPFYEFPVVNQVMEPEKFQVGQQWYGYEVKEKNEDFVYFERISD